VFVWEFEAFADCIGLEAVFRREFVKYDDIGSFQNANLAAFLGVEG
jgi:hypothetical protein